VFTGVFIGVIVSLINSNDIAVLLTGAPKWAAPFFAFPLLVAAITLVMIVLAVTGWVQRHGSAWGRIYYTLLTLAAIGCTGSLFALGLMDALFGV
jgi:hypothetical protein